MRLLGWVVLAVLSLPFTGSSVDPSPLPVAPPDRPWSPPANPVVRLRIVVDEAQDCTTVMASLVRRMVDGDDRRLMVLADPAQTIYPSRYPDARRAWDARGRQNVVLRLPYRSTRQIHALAASLEGDDADVVHLQPSTRDGPLPVVRVEATAREQERALVDCIAAEIADEQEERRPSEIAVPGGARARHCGRGRYSSVAGTGQDCLVGRELDLVMHVARLPREDDLPAAQASRRTGLTVVSPSRSISRRHAPRGPPRCRSARSGGGRKGR